MKTGLNALLVFCEGAHDVAFIRMIMKEMMGYDKVEIKFSEMPSPFHNLFKTAVENMPPKICLWIWHISFFCRIRFCAKTIKWFLFSIVVVKPDQIG